jgi:hypothetical protein
VALFLPRSRLEGAILRRIIDIGVKVGSMSMNVYIPFILLACGWTSIAIPMVSRAAETIERTVEGTVVATDVTADPQTIVVEVTLPNKKEALVVGARVPTDTRIKRGKQDAQLADVKVGEKAAITYLKTPDGLIARSVHVR